MSEEVQVKVSADSSALNSGLAAAKQAVDGFKEHAEESIKDLGGEMLEGLGFAAVIEGAHSLIEEFSKVQDEAERLGTSAESVQRLGAVAQASGSDMESFAKALQKGTRNAVEALDGNQELAGAFEKLNVDAAEFASASPEDQLVMVAEGFQRSAQNGETLLALFQALGKSADSILPALRKGPEALREELESASVASNETVATLKEAGERMESFWRTIKTGGAEALNGLIHGAQRVGAVLSWAWAYVENLPHGFKAAEEAANQAAQAISDIEEAKDKARAKEEADRQKRKSLDPEAEAAKKQQEQEQEAARLKAENDKKAHENLLRTMTLLQRKAALEKDAAAAFDEQKHAKTDAEQEKARGKRLDVERELASVNKEIKEQETRKAEQEERKRQEAEKKHNEEVLREKIKAQKEVVKEGEKTVESLKRASEQHLSVDDIARNGGGAAHVNYRAGAQRDEILRQHLEQAKKSVEIQEKILNALETQSQAQPLFDPAFST